MGLRRYSLSEKAVLAAYRELHSTRKTADRFGCSVNPIRRILHKHGVPIDGTPAMFIDKEQRREHMRKLIAEGKMGGRGKDSGAWTGGRIRVNCCVCGQFTWKGRAALENMEHPTCNKKCSGIRTSRYNTGVNNVNYKGGPPRLVCLNCGDVFRKARKKHTKRIFCSKKCMTEYVRGDQTSPWLGGISFAPYPVEWTLLLKESIRQRDGHRCRLCGKTQKESGQLLSVHHIDYDKDNLDPRNLVSLDRACHTKTNSNRKHWQRYFSQVMRGKRTG